MKPAGEVTCHKQQPRAPLGVAWPRRARIFAGRCGPTATAHNYPLFTIGVRRSRTAINCQRSRLPNQDVVAKQAETDQPRLDGLFRGFRRTEGHRVTAAPARVSRHSMRRQPLDP